MRLKPALRISGRISVPGDKSISHRAAIIAAIAQGHTRVTNFASSDDCAATLSCLRQLGVSIAKDGNTVRIEGTGLTGFRPTPNTLDCKNSGSTMRMLAGVLAAQSFSSTLSGDASLQSRPMGRVIKPLEMMGATVESRDGKPPLKIAGKRDLKPIEYRLPVQSAQVKSCVLFAGMSACGETAVIEQLPVTRDHTERMLNWFGVPVGTEMLGGLLRTTIIGERTAMAHDVIIPGDVSSAAFLIAATTLIPGSWLDIVDVGLNPTRTRFISTFQSLGMDITPAEEREECNEPLGNVHVRYSEGLEAKRSNNVVTPESIPQLIDELPLLAVVATQVQGGMVIRNAGELRLKESDRIASTVRNLRAMQAEVEEFDDGFAVPGPQKLRGASLDAFGDHRIAMAFTVASLIAEGESDLHGAECVNISFPEFFSTLSAIVEF